jgi:hypothetical protein
VSPMTDCPHPEKHRHVSCAAALVHLEVMDGAGKADLTLKPYRCGDHWHLGHKSKGSLNVQIKRALSSGRKASQTARRRRTR